MATHYNAFISYRHVSRDISVARDVQFALEHYNIPKEVQERYGIKKIDRVFRDKDELSLSGDLTENIEEALLESDWLIVICSEHTHESEWVSKEIETFLNTHSFDRVLTVLSSGEPVDVVPERLTYRIEKKTMPDGTEEEVRIPTEALACDYRMPFRKVRRQEVPRLAAAIIGCSYDELIRRAEQYRQRHNRIRSAVIGVSALIVSGYLLWSNNKIQDSLSQSQRNQSRYLATESLAAFEEHDRLTAIELALAALPEKDNRPVVAEAEYALAKAAGVYEIPGSKNNDMYTVSKYDSDFALIYDFWVKPNGMKMAYTDEDNYLNIIDLYDNSLVLERQLRPASQVIGSTEDALIIAETQGIKAVSWEDYSALWYAEPGFGYVYSDVSREGRILVTNSDEFAVFDSSGKAISTGELPDENWIYQAHISPDGRYVNLESWTDEGYLLFLFPAEGGPMKLVPGVYNDISQTLITDDGHLLILDLPDDFDKITYTDAGTDYCFEMQMVLSSFDVGTLEKEWEQEIVFSRFPTSELVQSFFIDTEGTRRECAVCSVADTQVIVDTSTGGIIRKAVFPESIVGLLEDGLNSWVTMLKDGRIGRVYYEDECFTVTTVISSGVRKIAKFDDGERGGILVLDEQKTAITRYEPSYANPNFRDIGEFTLTYNSSSDLKNGILVCVDNSEIVEGCDVMYIYDTKTYTLLHTIELDRYSFDDNLIGFLSDMSAVFTIECKNSDVIFTADVKSGEVRKYVQGPAVFKTEMSACVKGERSFLMYLDRDGKVFLSVYDVRKDDEKILSIDISGVERVDKFTVNDPMTYAVAETYSEKGKDLYLINLQDGTAVLVSSREGEEAKGFGATIGDVIAAYRTEDSVKIIDLDGWMLSELWFDMPSVLSMCCRNDTLFVVTANGILTEYSSYGVEKGSWSIFLETGQRYNEHWPYYWKFSRDMVMVGQFTELNVVEFDQDQAKIMITNSCAFDPAGKQVIIRLSFDRIVGMFRICSADELIRIGREIIGTEELSDTQKKQYGLN